MLKTAPGLIFMHLNCSFMTTNQYVLEKGTVAWILEDKEKVRSFIAILKLSGYVQLPSYRMFREEAPDVQHQTVKNAMPRNQFVAVLQNLHFCDNTTVDSTNKYGKVDILQKHAKLTKCCTGIIKVTTTGAILCIHRQLL